ncbi:hypothetical protein WEU32_04185 [Brevundimonas sp. BH3]|uniref:hypothetical protein n=1 Tax=Brevundimonas sp. BH3 TaxID=3133089 RepID=UPI0032480F66
MTETQISKPSAFKTFPYGEAALWLGFIWVVVLAMDDSFDPDTIMLAAVFALAAIGVRATRKDREKQ